jgi:hypothetical protein
LTVRACSSRLWAVTTASDPEHEALLADSVGLALLVILESRHPSAPW